MGTTGCKPAKSGHCDDNDNHVESAESVSLGQGLKVHQLDGNNFLGRLEDASRLSRRSRGGLWRRTSSNAAASSTGRGSTTKSSVGGAGGGSSSARSSCYSDLSSGVWQHQQQHLANHNQKQQQQHFLNTAPAATGGSDSRSLDCGPAGSSAGGSRRGSSSPDAAESGGPTDASRMDLTTLLLQGFDPAAYEQRMAERRLAKFVRRPPRSTSAMAATAAAVVPETAEAPG